MWRRAFMLATILPVMLSSARVSGAETEKTSTDIALAFWNAFLDANTDEMAKFYAPLGVTAVLTNGRGSSLLGLPARLSDVGVSEDDVEAVIRMSSGNANIGGNARPASPDDLRAILQAAF